MKSTDPPAQQTKLPKEVGAGLGEKARSGRNQTRLPVEAAADNFPCIIIREAKNLNNPLSRYFPV